MFTFEPESEHSKSSIVLDIKPWSWNTDLDHDTMLKSIKNIDMNGLFWGAAKLQPDEDDNNNVLRIMCVVENDKVSIAEIKEQIGQFKDLVRSVEVDSVQKI